MNKTDIKAARKRAACVEHMMECTDESCIRCLANLKPDIFRRLARDTRLALDSLEYERELAKEARTAS